MSIYAMPIGYIQSIDSKRPKLDDELYHRFIIKQLLKYDNMPSMLASKVTYVYDTTGFRHDDLRSIAEKTRKSFLQLRSEYYDDSLDKRIEKGIAYSSFIRDDERLKIYIEMKNKYRT